MPFRGRHLAQIRAMRKACPASFPLDLLVRRPDEVAARYLGGERFSMAEAWSAVPEWIRKAEADWIAASTLHSQNNEELHARRHMIWSLYRASSPVSIPTGSETRRISATSQVVQ